AVAAEMSMEELHEQRVDFVGKVQRAVTEDLLKNGLELETVSLTGLDQTSKEFFNPDNAFDAQGLTRLTEEVEERRKQRNDIEQDTEVSIRTKDLEAEKMKLQIARDEEYARLAQEEEIELKRAAQATKIAQERALKAQESRQAEIVAEKEVHTSQIGAERAVEEERIEMEREIKERDIAKERIVETAEVERRKTVELAEQDKAIAIAERSKAQSESEAEADKARSLAVKAQEQVVTVRETEKAEREKQIELIEAAKAAEREAIRITVAAEADKKAAHDKAEAVRQVAQGDSDAEKLRAEAADVRYAVEAEGTRKQHEADNLLSTEQIAMQVKLAIINNLSAIVEQAVKPIENIDGIKIVQVDGLNGFAGGANGGIVNGGSGSGRSGNLAEEVVSSALKYRAQAPLLDSLMKEVGISGDSLSGLTGALSSQIETLGDGENGSTNGRGFHKDPLVSEEKKTDVEGADKK
ncbi:flotillin, partial [bacterium J17]